MCSMCHLTVWKWTPSTTDNETAKHKEIKFIIEFEDLIYE